MTCRFEIHDGSHQGSKLNMGVYGKCVNLLEPMNYLSINVFSWFQIRPMLELLMYTILSYMELEQEMLNI